MVCLEVRACRAGTSSSRRAKGAPARWWAWCASAGSGGARPSPARNVWLEAEAKGKVSRPAAAPICGGRCVCVGRGEEGGAVCVCGVQCV